jgi:hypothetical protein
MKNNEYRNFWLQFNFSHFTTPPPFLTNSLEAIKGAAITDEEAHKAAVLGWALEWVSM